jgi:protein phosphatase
VRVAGAAHRTDPGRKRRRNEDSYVCEPPLFAVADGMGGAQAGEVASQLAAGALREFDGRSEDGEQLVVELIQEANRRVWQRANEDAAASGMGTTVTVALVEPEGRVIFGHVGDSRAYLLRDDRLEQLTDDHSLVAELVRRGELSPKEAETHPQRSVITRALGTDPDVDVDTFEVDARDGDLFLICSDGLSSMVDDATVERVLTESRADLEAAAKALVAAANRGGGEDNITAVLFALADGDEPAEDATDARPAVAAEEQPAPHDEDEDTLEGIRSPAADDAHDLPDSGPAAAPGPEPAPEPAPAVDTMVVPPEEAAALTTASGAPGLSLVRRLLVLLVIAALVLWGLAR